MKNNQYKSIKASTIIQTIIAMVAGMAGLSWLVVQQLIAY